MSQGQKELNVKAPDLLAPAVAAVTILGVAWIGRRTWFYSDDWDIFAYYHTGRLLEPFNGHLSLVPAGLYQLIFHTLGVGSYWPFRICGLVSLAILAFQTVRFAAKRFSSASGIAPHGMPVGAATAVVLAAILWNPTGKMVLLFPFLMNFTLPIAALLAIWWHLDKKSRRNDVAASIWLTVALATSGLGLMAAAAVGVELLVGRAGLRRWLTLSPGPVLWAIWFFTHPGDSSISTDVGAVLAYGARMYLGATTSLAAGWKPGGVVLALGFVVFVVFAAWKWRSLDARAAGAICAPVAFILFTAVTRLDVIPRIAPDELRYAWTVAAYLVLCVVVLVRPDRAVRTERSKSFLCAIGAVLLLAVVVGGVRLVPELFSWSDQVAKARAGLTSLTFVTEAVGSERIDPDLVIPLSYVPVTAGAYLEAVQSLGSPISGVSAADLGGDGDVRSVSDTILVEQMPIRVTSTDTPVGGDGKSCRSVDPTGAEPPESSSTPGSARQVFDIAAGTLVSLDPASSRPAVVTVSRIGPPGDARTLELPGEVRSTLSIPADSASAPEVDRKYRIGVPVGVRVAICPG